MRVTRQTSVIVLAGGASRRMGTDKRFVLIEGEPLLQRVLGVLPPALEILVVVDPTRPLPTDMFHDPRVRPIPDIRPGAGPLAGLEAGLSEARGDTALVVAGDMPWLEPAVVQLLADRLASDPRRDLVCLATEHGSQLPATCRRATTLDRVTDLLDSGERRLRALLDHPSSVALGSADWHIADPDGRSLRDIDTPADLASAG